MSQSRSRTGGIQLPPELRLSIFDLVETKDLAALCLVSKTLQEEAETILYRYIVISNISDGERLVSWCRAVVGRPWRAISVRGLKFPTHFKLPDPSHVTSTSEVHDSIAQAFRSLPNLQALQIERGGGSHPSLLPSTFDHCTFSLDELIGDLPGFSTGDIWKLLSLHPNMRYWVPGNTLAAAISPMPADVVPHLRDCLLAARNPLRPSAVSRYAYRVVLYPLSPYDTFISCGSRRRHLATRTGTSSLHCI
ncbi:hypothetical protein JAAARDRAFT_657071 [Jaapia argillacea MUCL 33604]|uniref:F-box domain-containing protein n=1 Tax=Jaapia argillacea MUCL 33604 TaxID=933084 RepID=A0A067Q6Y7_9AGAM|nr:hypothetical protein JAAARDRAFT_657071 [Jaapia argillacea MUCL 33604]